MQFGIQIPQGVRRDLDGLDRAEHWPAMKELAVRAEELGFEGIWLADHYHTLSLPSYLVPDGGRPPASSTALYEAWTTAASLAAITSRVRIGHMALANTFRSPAVTAKSGAVVDVISNGRLDFGIGAGSSFESEYVGYGLELPDLPQRASSLRESVQLILRLWKDVETTYQGKHYRLERALCDPKPIQDPHPPIWIAGGGEKVTLRLVAQHANWSNVVADVATFERKMSVLNDHCSRLGREPASIGRSTVLDCFVGLNAADVSQTLRWLHSRYSDALGEMEFGHFEERVRSRALVGTPDQIGQQLRLWSDAGCDYAILYFPEALFDTSGYELFASEFLNRGEDASL